MEYTAQQAAEAARNIGVDLEGEKIRPEALAAGMAVEAADTAPRMRRPTSSQKTR